MFYAVILLLQDTDTSEEMVDIVSTIVVSAPVCVRVQYHSRCFFSRAQGFLLFCKVVSRVAL